jgi:hypothetical protein
LLTRPPPLSYFSQGLSTVESDHVNKRLNPAKFISYLESINLTASALNLDLTASSSTNSTPNVALAFSGGGYRAMISGGGGLTATDGRASEAVAAGTGRIGGIASYIAGLSGGSWLIGSYLANNNASIPYLASNLWNLSSNLVVPSDGFFGTYVSFSHLSSLRCLPDCDADDRYFCLLYSIGYFTDLVSEVKTKKDEGFATQITGSSCLLLPLNIQNRKLIGSCKTHPRQTTGVSLLEAIFSRLNTALVRTPISPSPTPARFLPRTCLSLS